LKEAIKQTSWVRLAGIRAAEVTLRIRRGSEVIRVDSASDFSKVMRLTDQNDPLQVYVPELANRDRWLHIRRILEDYSALQSLRIALTLLGNQICAEAQFETNLTIGHLLSFRDSEESKEYKAIADKFDSKEDREILSQINWYTSQRAHECEFSQDVSGARIWILPDECLPYDVATINRIVDPNGKWFESVIVQPVPEGTD